MSEKLNDVKMRGNENEATDRSCKTEAKQEFDLFEFSVFLPPKAKTCECKHFKSVCLTNLLTV